MTFTVSVGAKGATFQSNANAITNVLLPIFDIVLGNNWCGRLCMSFGLTVHALNAFSIQGRFAPGGPLVPLHAAAADFTTPKGLIKAASGDLTTLAVGTGWVILEVQGIYEIVIAASSASASGTLCDINASCG